MRRTALACLSLVLVSLAPGAHAGDAARDAERAGASIGAGIGSIVGGAVDRIGRGIEAATAPRPAETVVIERRTVVTPVVPARPCVTTADGVRVCVGD